ncbi:MAG TPA: hypothetical protein VH396_13535 [Chitinophagaceae bacterium]|jgi:hypothetical protein
MDSSFIHNTDALLLCIFLFIAMIAIVALGRIAGRLWRKEDAEPRGGVNSLLAAVFALFGFILAFTFNMSGDRYENVRNVIVEEANDIGTAVLRADLYADSIREAFRADFKKYLEARIAYYDSITDTMVLVKSKENAAIAATALWSRAMQQSKLPNMLIPSNNMIPALNAMFDIATTREVMLKARVPDGIVYMLFILALASSFIAGFTSSFIRKKDWIIVAGFALLSSMIIYITLDLGRTTRGFIRTDMGQQAIIDLQKMF